MTGKLTNTDILNAIQLYQSGMSFQDISVRLGVGATTIRGHIINAGVPIRTRSEIISLKRSIGEWSPPTNSPRHIQILSENLISAAAREYQEGQSLQQLSDKFGVGRTTLSRYFRLRGIETRNRCEQFMIRLRNGNWKRPNKPRKKLPDNLIELYKSGVTVRELSVQFHICRKELAAHLKQSGIKFDRRAMLILREGETGLSERMKAVSDRAKSTSQAILKAGKERAAQTRHINGGFVGQYEVELLSELQNFGLNPIQQFPVSTYNIDIAIDKLHIAIEIERGSWHGAKSMSFERLEKLISTGWRVIVVRTGRFGCPIQFKAIAEKIAALAHLPSGHPASVGQYGVVTREAKSATRIPGYFHDWARIAGF